MGVFNESYSSVDLAKILGVHRVTVTNWIKMGALRAVKTPGGRYKVSKEDLIDFFKKRKIPIPPFLKTEDTKLVVAVDDDKNMLRLLKRAFSAPEMTHFFQLKTFRDPLDAALFIGDSKPDIVLLDLLMPQLDGFNLAKKIKLTSPHTRIIVITGHATKENLRKLESYNVEAILIKPFELKALKEIIKDSLI